MGAKFVWPDKAGSVRRISVAQLKLLLGGLSVDPPRGFTEVKARDF
jgi:transposase